MRFRSSCACTKSHPGFCSQLTHSIVFNDSVSGIQRPCSDCAYAQSDLGLRCMRMSKRHNFAWCDSKSNANIDKFISDDVISVNRASEDFVSS